MIRIIIMGSRKVRHRTGCCGSRTQEDVIRGFIPTLYRTFGQRRINCKYLDIDDPGADAYPDIVAAVRRKDLGLPLAIRDGKVILHGQNTLFELPDYIRQALRDEGDTGSPSQTRSPQSKGLRQAKKRRMQDL
jgi:disulfide oxidoreductase YuzD